MIFPLRVFCIAFIALGLISCSSNESASPSGDPGGGGGGGGSSSGSSSSNRLELVVRRNYEGHKTKIVVGTCAIAPSEMVIDRTCNMRIPELDLYHSELEFTVATNNVSTCTKVIFIPYSYRRSVSATFAKDNEEGEVDCSAPIPTDLYCYGGAAKEIVEGFPYNNGHYFLTVNSLSYRFLLPSTDSRRATDKERSMYNNVAVANNLVNRASNISNSNVRYVQDSSHPFTDYTVECRDQHGLLNHRLTLILGDNDTPDVGNNGVNDEFYDWGN